MDVFDSKPWRLFAIFIGVLGAILAVLFIAHASKPPVIASAIRIQNDTGTPLLDVRINGVTYGDLAIGGLSKYQSLAPAYRYAEVELCMLNKKVHIRPDDYLGEVPLGEGAFTYKIQNRTAHEGLIGIQTARD